MANAATPLGYIKPEVGADTNLWGGHTNENWDLNDTLWQRFIGTTTTHLLSFDVSTVSTTTTRTVTWIDEDVTVVGTSNAQTLTNKTLDSPAINTATISGASTAVTQAAGDSSTKIATTAFVGWAMIATEAPSAATVADFTGIATSINHLMILYELNPGTDAAIFAIQTYGADRVLDIGASDYAYAYSYVDTAPTSPAVAADSANTGIAISATADNSGTGCSGIITAANIQAATSTKFHYQTAHQHSNGVGFACITGSGVRVEAARITGIRFLVTTGTMTGKITLYGSV